MSDDLVRTALDERRAKMAAVLSGLGGQQPPEPATPEPATPPATTTPRGDAHPSADFVRAAIRRRPR